jgi:hypothetical protein
MIISNIIGGLGNQMFQYACGRSMSLRTRQSLRLSVDRLDFYASHNGFELHRVFNIDAPLATEDEMKKMLGWQSSPLLRYFIGRPSMRWLANSRWANEPHFQFWPGLASLQGPLYLHGYWQSEHYFQEYADQIRADFTFKMDWDVQDEAILQRMRDQPSVSLHVRRGDYAKSKNDRIYASCDLDYYREAIRLIRNRVPAIKLFAFSDDPDWVEAHLSNEFGPLEVIRHNSGSRSANDMRLMSQADHHIIANSSFSWWGAWLNPSHDKIVVAPRLWFVNGTDDSDLIPASWIRV